VLDDLQLLVSEVVTNALRHAAARPGDSIHMRVSTSAREVRVEVCDPGRGTTEPRPRRQPGPGPGGYGLWMVDRMASHWGVRRNHRTCVWFTLKVG
jgi:anti-sigma regulatory factor (Ser/Thr protein kinase)